MEFVSVGRKFVKNVCGVLRALIRSGNRFYLCVCDLKTRSFHFTSAAIPFQNNVAIPLCVYCFECDVAAFNLARSNNVREFKPFKDCHTTNLVV